MKKECVVRFVLVLFLLSLGLPPVSNGGSLHWGGRSHLSGGTRPSRGHPSTRQFRRQHRPHGRHTGSQRRSRRFSPGRPGIRHPHNYYAPPAPFAERLHRSRRRRLEHDGRSHRLQGHHHHQSNTFHGRVYLDSQSSLANPAGPPPRNAPGLSPLGAAGSPPAVISSPFFCYPHKRGYTKQDQFVSHLYQHHKVPRRRALSVCHSLGSSLLFLGD